MTALADFLEASLPPLLPFDEIQPNPSFNARAQRENLEGLLSLHSDVVPGLTPLSVHEQSSLCTGTPRRRPLCRHVQAPSCIDNTTVSIIRPHFTSHLPSLSMATGPNAEHATGWPGRPEHNVPLQHCPCISSPTIKHLSPHIATVHSFDQVKKHGLSNSLDAASDIDPIVYPCTYDQNGNLLPFYS